MGPWNKRGDTSACSAAVGRRANADVESGSDLDDDDGEEEEQEQEQEKDEVEEGEYHNRHSGRAAGVEGHQDQGEKGEGRTLVVGEGDQEWMNG